jgi:hypothetical protein
MHSLLGSVKKWYYWDNSVDDTGQLIINYMSSKKNFISFSKEWVTVLGKYFFNMTHTVNAVLDVFYKHFDRTVMFS